MSPVVLFAYNRPGSTRQVLAALAANIGASESELIVVSDGPRTAEDEVRTAEVRALCANAAGFSRIRIVARTENLGSAVSIRDGLNQLFDEHERLIVLEDDLIPSVYFLQYANRALDYYAKDDAVVSVCGYSPPGMRCTTQTYLLPGAHCWGWATWRRSWNAAEQDAGSALQAILHNRLAFEFDMRGAEACTMQLNMAARGKRDSWVLPWMASAILNRQLTLYPATSLIHNAGLSDMGVAERYHHLFTAALSPHCPEIDAPGTADWDAYGQIRSMLIRWKYRNSRLHRLPHTVERFVPDAIRRSVYDFGVRRALRAEGAACK